MIHVSWIMSVLDFRVYMRMARHPTPIADQLTAMGESLTARLAEDRAVGAAELECIAGRLLALAGQAAPLERFHAEMIAEAAEEELRQFTKSADLAASGTGLPVLT